MSASARLGQMGEVVSVKAGYARNYLLPKGKALRATPANMERFEKERAQLEARNLELKKDAGGVADKLNGESFVIIRQAGESGQLYGSVSPRDIATAATEGGFTVSRQQIVLDRPIKALGLHDIRVALHAEVDATITINVARSEEEAERQARGEDVTATPEEDMETDEGETISAEDVFEDEELARQAAEKLDDADTADDGESETDEPEARGEADGDDAAPASSDKDD